MSRTYDIVVFAASGFTGRLVVKYLASAPSARFYRWAVAGRDASRLKAVVTEAGAADTPIIIADSADAASLEAVCANTLAVIACAGPFDLIGMPLVDACMKQGTHYVDITGEPRFMRRVIEKHHAAAREKRIIICPAAGFDCVPSDVGNFVAHNTASAAGMTLVKVRGLFNAKSSPSGGTMATIANAFTSKDKVDLRDGASLLPADERVGVPTPTTTFIGRDGILGFWCGPYFMAMCNERVTRRSNYLLGRAKASYVEAFTGTFGAVVAHFLTCIFVVLVMTIAPLKKLFYKYVAPKQGSGPSDKAMEAGYFHATFVGTTSVDAPGNKAVRTVVKDNRDCYVVTALFVAEAAMAAVDLAKRAVDAGKPVQGGVLTTAAAFGEPYVQRLRTAGISISSEVFTIGDKLKSE